MSILISAHQIEKSFGAKTLFSKISFGIESGDRIGLIGPNGAGKTTLLKIIMGEEKPDVGDLSFQRGLRIAWLDQTPSFSPDETVESALLKGFDPHDYDPMMRAEILISHLNLDSENVSRNSLVAKLSGGWRKKVALARELMKEPQLLLLDEPTNHLDLESIFWLEEFLQSQPDLATLTVTHDRLFLQKVSTQIFDLDRKYPDGLLKIRGTYSDYLEVREQFLSGQLSTEEARKNDLRRETAWLRRGAKARQTKQKARIERAGDLKEEVLELRQRNQNLKLDIDLASQGRSPKKLIEAKNISKSFNDRPLFKNLDFIISPKTRLGLLGRNGCGKSTLIKTLLGELKPDTGDVKINEQLQVNYFEQQRDSLNLEETVFKTLCPAGDYVHLHGNPVHARSYLSRFKFRPDQYDMPLKKLSGGEQARLLIAKLMLTTANVLVLDEPTNDLDIATLDVLKEALDSYDGAVILVTHDRFFLEQTVDTILAFTPEGELVKFAGYFQWESWQEQQVLKKKEAAAIGKKKLNPSSKTKLSYKDQREYDSMEENIQKLEARLNQLQIESQKSEITSDAKKLTQLSDDMAKLQTEIDRLYARWSELGPTN